MIKDQQGHEPDIDIDKCISHSSLLDPLSSKYKAHFSSLLFSVMVFMSTELLTDK